MKTAFLCALILSQIAAEGRELTFVRARRCVAPSATVTVLTQRTTTLRIANPAPVAEMTNANGQTVEGAFVRVATAPQPLQMINPVAPPEYGAARNLLTFTDDPNRNDNPNIRLIQPNGVRLLTLRSFW